MIRFFQTKSNLKASVRARLMKNVAIFDFFCYSIDLVCNFGYGI